MKHTPGNDVLAKKLLTKCWDHFKKNNGKITQEEAYLFQIAATKAALDEAESLGMLRAEQAINKAEGNKKDPGCVHCGDTTVPLQPGKICARCLASISCEECHEAHPDLCSQHKGAF